MELIQTSYSQSLIQSLTSNSTEYKIEVREKLFKNGVPKLHEISQVGVSVAKYREVIGFKQLVGIVTILIVNMQNAFNTPRKMNESQISDLAITIVDENPNLKVEDLMAFFEMAKAGKFSKSYSTIDAPLINEWLFEYKQIRTDELERQRLIEHSKFKSIKSEQLTEYQIKQWDIIKQKLIAGREEMERESIARKEAERERLSQERIQLLEYAKNITKQLKNGQYGEGSV